LSNRFRSPLKMSAAEVEAHAELVQMMVNAFRHSGPQAATFADYLRQVARREERSAVVERFLASWDVLLCPVARATRRARDRLRATHHGPESWPFPASTDQRLNAASARSHTEMTVKGAAERCSR